MLLYRKFCVNSCSFSVSGIRLDFAYVLLGKPEGQDE